jgi:hypothetical protein
MAKKLISVWLSLTILIFSSISIYADEVIQGDFFLKNIVINGENIVNYQLSNPVLIHANRTYVPMDTEMGRILGFEAEWDNESRTLKILKTEPTQKNVSDTSVKNNLENVKCTRLYDVSIIAYTEAQKEDARLAGGQADATASDQNSRLSYSLQNIFSTFSILNTVSAESNPQTSQETGEIKVPELSAVQIELKGQPVLVKNEIVYVPINAIVSSETLGWSSYYDSYAGVYISTDDEIDAASYFNAATSRYYEALSAYIVKQNPKLKMSQAFEMVKYFEAYGQIYGVDLKLLISMAQSESCFVSNLVNSANCCGLMQIKVSTGSGFGFTKAQLLQVKPNIQMGAMYISNCLAMFGGDKVKALSAYNCGPYAVKKGNYKTGYANKIISRIDTIGSFVASY